MKRVLYVLAVLGVGAVVVLLWAKWPPGPVVLIYSPQTTYLASPPRADGGIDYLGAIAKALGEAPLAEDNAAIPLIQAVGPASLLVETRDIALKALGLPPFPEKGDWIVSLEDHAENRGEKKRVKDPMAYEHVEEWLRENEKPLSLLRVASEKKRFYLPLVSLSSPPRLTDAPASFRWTPVLAGTKALLCRARRSLAAGDDEAAWADTLAVLRLGALACQDWTILSHDFGKGMTGNALEIATEIAMKNESKGPIARRRIQDLSGLPVERSAVEIFGFYRLSLLEMTVDFFVTNGRKGGAGLIEATYTGLDPNVILRELNSWFNLYEEAWKKQEGMTARLKETRAVTARLEQAAQKAREDSKSLRFSLAFYLRSPSARRELKSELIERLLLTENVVRVWGYVEKSTAIRARVRLLTVALALVAGKAEHGEYAGRLSDLAPEILKEVPLDPCTDEPLRFFREGEGFVLYSAGLDGSDDGGEEEKDIVLRFE